MRGNVHSWNEWRVAKAKLLKLDAEIEQQRAQPLRQREHPLERHAWLVNWSAAADSLRAGIDAWERANGAVPPELVTSGQV